MNRPHINFSKDMKGAIMFLLFVVFGLSFYANLSFFAKTPEQKALFPPFMKGTSLNENFHLGAEYYNIADSLASGKGFSNPFQEETGPTAWMPPMYPYLLALLLKILKTKKLVVLAVLILKNSVLVFTGAVIYGIAKRSSSYLNIKIILFIYVLWLVTFFRWYFQMTHDIWIILLFLDIILLLSFRLSSNPSKKNYIYWGIAGGISALTSPILGLVWGSVSAVSIKKAKKSLLVASFVIFVVFVSAWTARNYMVFKRIIFIKSNLFFDAYQANYVNDIGVLDEHSFSKHPFLITKLDFESEYEKIGETEFIVLYKDRFVKSITRYPSEYFRRVLDRLLAVFIVYHPYNKDYEHRFLTWKSIVHTLPFLSLICIFLLRKNISADLGLPIFIYIVFLVPYILITYYIRYSLVLAPLQVLFIYWGVDSIYSRLKNSL